MTGSQAVASVVALDAAHSHHSGAEMTPEAAGLLLFAIVGGAAIGVLYEWAYMDDEYVFAALLGAIGGLAGVMVGALAVVAFGGAS